MAELEVRLSGTGGQGLILAARILAGALNREGRKVAQSQTYEPTSRGGTSRADLVVGDEVPDYPLVTALDALLVLDQRAVADSEGLIKPGALVLTDKLKVTAPPAGDLVLHALPFVETARRLGSERVANIVALGTLVELGRLATFETLREVVQARAPKALLDLNLEALEAGRRLALDVAGAARLPEAS